MNIINEIAKKTIVPIFLLFSIPLNYLKSPFSFHKYVKRDRALGDSITIFIEMVLIQIYVMTQLYGNVGVGKSIFIQSMNSPITGIAFQIWNMVLIVGTAIPACKYMTKYSAEEVYQRVIITIMFFAVFSKIISLIQISPILASYYNLIDFNSIWKYIRITTFLGIGAGIILLITLVVNIKKIDYVLSYKRIFLSGLIWLLIYLVLAVLSGIMFALISH